MQGITEKVNRIWGLEVFRFILVWMTFLFHAWGNGISFKQMDFFVGNGAVAMEGFFLLSGFVTYIGTRNLAFTDKNGLIKFYKRKVFRVVPFGVVKLVLCKMVWPDFSVGGYCGYPMKFYF